MKWWQYYLRVKRRKFRKMAKSLRQRRFLQLCLSVVIAVIAMVLLPQIALVVIIAFTTVTWLCKWRYLSFGLVLSTCCLCLWYFPQLTQIDAFYIGSTQKCVGVTLEVTDTSSYSLEQTAEISGVPGLQTLQLKLDQQIPIGTKFEAVCKYAALPEKKQSLRAEGFRYVVTLSDIKVLGLSYELDAQFARLKQQLVRRIGQSIAEPQASLLVGLVLGGKAAEIPTWLSNDLKLSGLSHIASISGYNVNVVVSGLIALAGLIPRRKLYLVLIPALVLFLIFIGAHNLPAQRAVVMGVLLLIEKFIGRRQSIWELLIFALAVMCVIDPFAVNSVSLWLSIFAYLGVNGFTHYWAYILINFSALVRETLSATLGVYAASMPILISIFGSVSLTGLIANILVLPLIPPTMAISFVAISLLWMQPFAEAAFKICDVMLKMIIFISGVGARINFLQISDSRVGWLCWILMLLGILFIDIRMELNAGLVKT